MKVVERVEYVCEHCGKAYTCRDSAVEHEIACTVRTAVSVWGKELVEGLTAIRARKDAWDALRRLDEADLVELARVIAAVLPVDEADAEARS